MLARLVEVGPGGGPDTSVALTFQRVNSPHAYDAAFLTTDEVLETVRDMLRSLPHDDRERAVKMLAHDFDEHVAERFCASLRPQPGD